jgi:hypothetical protein
VFFLSDHAVLLKLKAQDTDDLQVISAHMQDALVKVRDITYAPKTRKFACVANRFAWDSKVENERRRTGLHFENVLKVRRKGFTQADGDVVLSLLSITFSEIDAPSGIVTLTFSAGHVIELAVEYLDCALRDLGPAWRTEFRPDHET